MSGHVVSFIHSWAFQTGYRHRGMRIGRPTLFSIHSLKDHAVGRVGTLGRGLCNLHAAAGSVQVIVRDLA